jgi:periplasmic protein TonB
MSQSDLGVAGGFGKFGSYGGDDGGDRHWLAASLTSLLIYAGIAIAVVLLGTATKRAMIDEKKVDVTFVEKVVMEPPPPPPPPVEIPKPPEPQAVKPAAAAPVIRPDMKVRKLDKPPPPKELVAPKAMPKAPAKEADPSEDKGVAVVGEGVGDPAGLEGGLATGGVAGGMVGGAIALPENATPPKPLKSNPIPQYPQQARAAGKTATVILKVIVLADGSVADVQVMRGDEPFSSAAIQTVKKWRYEPAVYKGQPITVYRVVRIPFKLRA